MLGDLLDQIPQEEPINSVYTDGAYDTKRCRQVIASRKAHKRLGRRLWKKWSDYHRRSLVETKIHCIKLLGDKLSAGSFDSQVNEIHARIAVLNKFTELGQPHTQVVT